MQTTAESLLSGSHNSSPNSDATRISLSPPPISAKSDGKQTVLIAGTRELFRAAIRALLESVSPLQVVGEAQNDLETFDLVERLRPGVLLLDTGINPDLLPTLRLTSPQLRIIALTHGDRAIPSVDASVSASADVRTLLEAIQCEPHADDTPTGTKSAVPFGLTQRELDVVRAIAEGRTNQEIAKKLAISLSTVKHYVTRVFDKLGVFNRVELVIFAMNHNLHEVAENVDVA